MFNVIFGEKVFLTQSGDKVIVETVENEDNCTVSECDFKQFLCTYKSKTKYENREIAYFSIACDNRSMILSGEFWKETNIQNLFVRKYESLDERIKKASSESDDELILELDYPRTRIKNVEKSTGL